MQNNYSSQTLSNLTVISAGAGSGKTYTLTHKMSALLTPDAEGKTAIRASGIIATSFTKKSAAELAERVRITLLQKGLTTQADDLANALIGTVHSISTRLLKRFAFEAGVSPRADIIADGDTQMLFNNALAACLTPEIIEDMQDLAERLGFFKTVGKAHDWRKDVRELIDIIRINNLDEVGIEKSKQYSINSLLQFLPARSSHSEAYFTSQLQNLLKSTLDALSNNGDATGVTDGYKNMLRGCLRLLNQGERLAWYDWARLCKAKPGKNSKKDAEELTEFVALHDTHPLFQDDIKDYTTKIFDLALAAIKEYAEYKKTRGLIDYTDMETLLLRLLENPEVQVVIKDELDLLLVDEFQDTSPLQLQIFLQLTKLAKQAIWVGDPKQSIYGFRGADPALMEAVMERAAFTETLKKSYRSREDLVNSVNAIFVKAFPQMPAERVQLQCANGKDKEPADLKPAMIQWHFKPEEPSGRAPSKDWTERALAKEITNILNEGNYRVRDKQSGGSRPLRAGDIAVLCKTNRECASLAQNLAADGIDASTARSGLLETAEAQLLLACLKFMLNPQDSLSVAEILLLADAQAIEAIIDNRLDYLDKKQALRDAGTTERRTVWGSDNFYIKTLEKLRNDTKESSSSEILNMVLESLDLRRIITAWGNTAQRSANVEAFCALASQYEEACNRLHTAATLGGLLLWLGDLANQEKDSQGNGGNANAVNLLTYHASKGLEYPFTICASLDNEIKDNLFGFAILAENPDAPIDLDNPLAGRLIRYWLNPYADQDSGTGLSQRLDESPEKLNALKRALAEETRLLYVGLTRARDYLVLPTKDAKEGASTKWLNRVFHNGQGNIPVLDEGMPICPWVWESYEIPKTSEIFVHGKEFDYDAAALSPVPYLPARTGTRQHAPLSLNIETLAAPIAAPKVKVGKTILYSTPLTVPLELEDPEMAQLLNAFLCAALPTYPLDEQLQMAEHLLKSYRVSTLKAPVLLAYGQAFYSNIQDLFAPTHIQAKHYIRQQINGRILEMTLDFYLQTPQGVVIITDNTFAGESNKWKNKALEDAKQLSPLATALQPTPRFYVHFPLGGGLQELVYEGRA